MSHIRLGTINSDNVLQVNQPISSQSYIEVFSTTDSTSNASGSLVVHGGLGLAKNLTTSGRFVFSTPTLDPASVISLNTTVGADAKSLILSASNSTTPATTLRGAWIQLDGKDTPTTGDLTLGATNALAIKTGTTGTTALAIDNAQTVTIASTTPSTTSSNGALVVAGGIGVAGQITTSNNIVTNSISSLTGGFLTLTGTTNSTMTTALVINNISVSSSPTTGALQVVGGAGFNSDVNVAGNVSSLTTQATSTTNSTSTTTGASVVSGGLGVAKDVYTGGNLHMTNSLLGVVLNSADRPFITRGHDQFTSGNYTGLGRWGLFMEPNNLVLGMPPIASRYVSIATYNLNSTIATTWFRVGATTGNTEIFSTTASTTSTTGALTVAGGVGIAGALNVGSGGSSFTNTLEIRSTASTGLILNYNTNLSGLDYGYIDFRKNNVVQGNIVVTDESVMDINSVVTYGIAMARGGGNIGIGTNPTSRKLQVAGNVTISATDASTSTSTGALIVSGGTAIGGNIYTSGIVNITSTNLATDTLTGSLVTSGGIAVAKDSFFDATITGNALINRSSTFTLGTTATAEGDSGLSRALVKTAGNTLTLNYASDYAGGTIIDGPTTNIRGNILIAQTTSDVRNIDFPAGTTSSYIFNAPTTLGNGLNLSYNALNNNTSWAITDPLQATTRMTLANGTVSFFTGATNTAPTTQHLTMTHTQTTIYSPLTVQSTTTFSNTTDATAYNIAGTTFAGGVGIAKNLYVHAATTLDDSLSVNGNTTTYGTVLISNSLESTATTNGALVVMGGIGTEGNITMGGNLQVSGTSTFIDEAIFTSQLTLQDTTDSTTHSDGALVVSGGVGIAKNTNIQGTLTVTNTTTLKNTVSVTDTTQAFNATSGAITVAGGAGFAKNVYIGGNANVTGNHVTSGNSTTTGTVTVNNNTLIGEASGALFISSASPSLKVAANDANKTAQYANSITLFTLGNQLIDTNHEALQISSLSTDTYTILTRSAGTGSLRKLTLQSGGANTGQLTLNTDSTVTLPISNVISSSANPATPSGGSLNITTGDLVLGNQLFYSTSSPQDPPSNTVRSQGTRVVMYPNTSATTVDTAIGVENTTDLWFSSETAFRFYTGTTNVLTIDDNGITATTGPVTATSQFTVQDATADSIRIAPLVSGGTTATVYAYDDTYAPTATDGQIWYIGRNVNNQGPTTFAIAKDGPSGPTTTMWINNVGDTHLTSTTQSTLVGNGAVQIAGGLSVEKNTNIGGNLTVTGTITGAIESTAINLTSTTQSTTPTSGSLVTAGGAGIQKNANIGGDLRVWSTIDATSLTTGAFRVDGGASITKSLHVGDTLSVYSTAETTTTTTGAIVSTGGIATTKGITVGGSISLPTDDTAILFAQDAKIHKTLNGPLHLVQPPNGFHIRNTLNTASLFQVTNTGPTTISTQLVIAETGNSTNSTNGAVQVAGGVGIAKALFVGEGGTFGSAVTISGSSTNGFIFNSTSTAGGGNTYISANRMLFPNVATSTNIVQTVGISNTTYNQAYFGFSYAGLNSQDNYATIGLNAQNNVLNVFGSGRVAIGQTTNPTTKFHVNGTSSFTGNMDITSNTNSTSATTGAFKTAGGAGFALDVYVGGTLYATNALAVTGATTLTSALTINDTTETTVAGQGSIITAGGASIAKSTRIGNELRVIGGSYLAALTTTGTVTVSDTTQSTTTTNGALTLAGGLGVAKNAIVGGNLTLTGSAGTVTTSYLTVTEVVESTSATTGTVQIAGGVGIEKRLNVGGRVQVLDNTASTDATTGALTVAGGMGVSGDVYVGGNITATGTITSVSDARLKENVETLDENSVMEKLMLLRVTKYNMKGQDPADRQVGLIAQEVQQIFPELVQEHVSGMLSVDYAKLSLYLLLGFQAAFK